MRNIFRTLLVLGLVFGLAVDALKLQEDIDCHLLVLFRELGKLISSPPWAAAKPC